MILLKQVASKMEYIQRLFLSVQSYMQQPHELEEILAQLNTEPPEFRSVAYEAASMEIALLDIAGRIDLDNWNKFYQQSASAHTFHMDIGLGWAIAKNDAFNTLHSSRVNPENLAMVIDGIGYYYGLFKGRRTIKNQLIPEEVVDDLPHFDQGLGRRLWYISKGEVNVLNDLINTFPVSRHCNLWRGVGIATGYVGGSDQCTLEQLLQITSINKHHFCLGVRLAFTSRKASNSITPELELACKLFSLDC